ncbi:unnamed protein product [Mytilus edulis]|uniref:Uncharacterized protein n=1 Tax=Mytilus edulis TaxID=6550 RepID=A0A8S3S5P6_MYTED|nr:unnamed protein product [Mytilus edulis]
MRKKEYMKKKGDKGTLENLTNLLTVERDIELTPRSRGCNKKLLYCQVKLHEITEGKCPTMTSSDNHLGPMQKKEYMKKKGDKGTLENLKNLLTVERNIELTPRSRGCNKKLLYCQVKLHEITEVKCPTMTSSDKQSGPIEETLFNLLIWLNNGICDSMSSILLDDRINLIISPDIKPLNTDDGWDDDLCRY